MSESTINLEAMGNLVRVMNGAEHDLLGVKSDLAGILSGVSLDSSKPKPLQTAADWVHGQVPDLRRRLAAAQAIAASNPGLHGVVTVPESMISTIPPEQAAQYGKDAAEKIKNGEPLDPTLLQWLKDYSHDPYFAASLAKNCSPEEISAYVQNSYYARNNLSTSTPDYAAKYQRMLDDYKALVTGLGETVGTATQSESPDLKLPGDYANRWADAITDSGGPQAAVLGEVLRHGAYGEQFALTVATKVYDYERNDLPGRWADRVSGGTWQMSGADGKTMPADPLSGVMAMLGSNASASQEFFTTGGDEKVKVNGQEVQVNSRLKYLVQDRTWAGNRLSDEGDGLGKALRAATIAFRNHDETGKTSATLATQTLALIGEKTHEGTDGGFLGLGADDGWKMWTGMRDEVADIVADYVPDLYREYQDDAGAADPTGPPWCNDGTATGIGGAPYGLNFSRDHMKKILQTLGEQPENIDKVTTSAFAYNRVLMSAALRDISDPKIRWQILQGADYPPFTSAAKLGPDIVGTIINDAYEGKKSADEVAKARAEALKKFLEIASALPPLKIPATGIKTADEWITFGVDKTKGAALDQLSKGPDKSAGSVYGGRDVATQDALRRDFMNILLQNGFYDPEVIAEGQKQFPGAVNPPPDGALLRDSSGRVTGFNYQSDAYSQWVSGLHSDRNPTWGTAPGMKITDSIIGKYREQFPNIS